MRSFIESTVSYFAERVEAQHSTITASLRDAIVSGYSCPLSNGQQELCQDSCDRRQGGILYADVANYLCRTGEDEEGAHHRLVGSMKIIEAYVTANNGRVADTAGDAILVQFKEIENALIAHEIMRG